MASKDPLCTQEELLSLMTGKAPKSPAPANPGTSAEEQLQISGLISNEIDSKFGKKVLRPENYKLVYEQKKAISITFGAWGTSGRKAFTSHPRFANAFIYAEHINGLGKFMPILHGDVEVAREIVIAYSLFSDSVKYSIYEDWLWECSPEKLRKVAAYVGFPTGDQLQALKAKFGVKEFVTRVDLIRLLLDLQGIEHCIPQRSKEIESFMTKHRDTSFPTVWPCDV
jgi:hypothetical protein